MRPTTPKPDAIGRTAPRRHIMECPSLRRHILVGLGTCALWPLATRATPDDLSLALRHEPAGLTLHNGWILRPEDR